MLCLLATTDRPETLAIAKLVVKGPFKILRKGITLIDLPGKSIIIMNHDRIDAYLIDKVS